MFSFSNPFDTDIEKATSENNTSEDWGLILDICDKVGQSPVHAKHCLKSIIKRLNNADPHIVLKAIILLDACVNNCGKNFHLEIASRDFESEYRKLISKTHPVVQQKLRELLKNWAEGEFKSDPQLNLIPSLYNKLKQEGLDFTIPEMIKKKTGIVNKDPNAVSDQQEVDDIAKAIELSLKDKGSASKEPTGGSLYPVNINSSSNSPFGAASEARKVRALYDFEAAEDNELTFQAGEIIHVIDDSDANWWKGQNQRGEGLFPANFVTADLSVEPKHFLIEQSKKIKFQENLNKNELKKNEEIEINEEKIDRLLHLLHEADPSNPDQDTHEMINLEEHVNKMGPLIDSELERVDRKHAQLTQLSTDLVEALNLYHTLMREPQFTSLPKNLPYNYHSANPGYDNVYIPPSTTQYNSSAGGYGVAGSGVSPDNSAAQYINLQGGPVLSPAVPPQFYQAPSPASLSQMGIPQNDPNLPPINYTQG